MPPHDQCDGRRHDQEHTHHPFEAARWMPPRLLHEIWEERSCCRCAKIQDHVDRLIGRAVEGPAGVVAR